MPSVDDVKIVDREYGIGYLKLTCFQKTTSRDLDDGAVEAATAKA